MDFTKVLGYLVLGVVAAIIFGCLLKVSLVLIGIVTQQIFVWLTIPTYVIPGTLTHVGIVITLCVTIGISSVRFLQGSFKS